MGDLWEVDALQRTIFAEAGFEPDAIVPMVKLARALGMDVDTVRPAHFPGDGAFCHFQGQRRIFIRGGISHDRKRFACAHEIAEAKLPENLQASPHVEDICNTLAAALLAPRRAFTRRHNEVGDDWEQLAIPFGMTQTSAALRAGETEDIALAVVSKIMRTRGPEEFVWPSEPTIRGWVRRTPPGLAKTRLTDDPKRVVLVADMAMMVA